MIKLINKSLNSCNTQKSGRKNYTCKVDNKQYTLLCAFIKGYNCITTLGEAFPEIYRYHGMNI